MSPRLMSISSSRQTVTDIGGKARVKFAIISNNGFYAADEARRQHHNGIAGFDYARRHLSRIAAKIRVRAHYVLYWKAELVRLTVACNMHRFEIVQQAGAVKPRHLPALLNYVIAFERADRDEVKIQSLQARGIVGELGANLLEYLLAVPDQVHFVHRDYDVLNAQQRCNECVPARLRQYAVARIHQYDCEIGRGRAGRHVAGVLLVARSIRDDELAFGVEK